MDGNGRVDSISDVVRDIFAEYAASLVAGSPERWIALWTDDCVQLEPDEPARVGKDEVRAGLVAFLDMMAVRELGMEVHEVETAGPWAYARGSFRGVVIPVDEDPEPIFGQFLTVFQRQADGSWKMHRECYNLITTVE